MGINYVTSDGKEWGNNEEAARLHENFLYDQRQAERDMEYRNEEIKQRWITAILFIIGFVIAKLTLHFIT